MKIKKINKEKLGEQLGNLGILLCIVILVFIFMNYNLTMSNNESSYYKSWHNVDLIFNMQNIVNGINQANLYTQNGTPVMLPFDNLNDTGNDLITRPLAGYYIPSMNNIDDSYMNSTKSLNNYFLAGLLDVLVLGLLLGRKL